MPCATCRFYQLTGEGGSGHPADEHGACGHVQVRAQVRIVLLNPLADEAQERSRIRFRGDFECVHFEPAPW
jgi:hypothetical protein